MKKIILILSVLLSFTLNAQNLSVPFTLSEYGHIKILAKVDNIEGNFIFDTGAGLNVFFKRFYKKLAPRETYNFFVGHRATGEALECPIYSSKNVNIGTLSFKDQIYTTAEIDMLDIDGIISLQAFQNMPVIIDYEKKELVFGALKNKDKKKFIDIQINDQAGKSIDIYTYVKINDKITIQAILDSGAGDDTFNLSSNFFKILGLEKNNFKITENKSEFDSLKFNKVYTGTIAKISTVNNLVKAENKKVRFIDGLICEGWMSINWLGKKIAISLPDKKIYIIK